MGVQALCGAEREVRLKEVGQVVSVSEGAAVVAMRASGECEKCGLCMKSTDGKDVLLLAKNDVGARSGDRVEIEINPGRVIAAAFIVYMVPVVMTIVGYLLGSRISGGSDESGLPIAVAVIFLVASFIGVWLYDLRIRKNDRREATVLRVMDEDDEDGHRVQVVSFGG